MQIMTFYTKPTDLIIDLVVELVTRSLLVITLWALLSLFSIVLEYINVQANEKNKKEKTGISLVDVAYRRAKAAKAVKKALDAGKIVKKGKNKSNNSSQKNSSRTEEMRELFQTDE